MADHLPEPVPPEPSPRPTADRVLAAICLLLVLAAFSAKPLWLALDVRMRVYFALESKVPTWPAISKNAFTRFHDQRSGSKPELDQRSEVGVDPWGYSWVRWLEPSGMTVTWLTAEVYEPVDHEFEPGVSTYSSGPDGVPERGGGDDVIPYAHDDWRAVTCEQARLLILGLGVLIAVTYVIASRVPCVPALVPEGVFVVTMAFVPALACTVGVTVNYEPFLRELAPMLLWTSQVGLVATVLASMLLLWSLAIAAVQLGIAPRRGGPARDSTRSRRS